MNTKAPPTKVIASGGVEAAIWLNGESSGAAAEIRITRKYRDGNGVWRNSNRLFPQDLLRLRLVADEACRYVLLREYTPPQRAGDSFGARSRR